jgi:hypothetical protein
MPQLVWPFHSICSVARSNSPSSGVTYTITADVRKLFDAKSRDMKLYSEEGEVQSPGLCNRPGGGAKVV